VDALSPQLNHSAALSTDNPTHPTPFDPPPSSKPSQLWNTTHPATPIAGLSCTRAAAVEALRPHPPGTFICRLSFSQPGALIISRRLPRAHPHATSDGVSHVALAAELLRQRRADGWLRALPEASHLLDVASGARVDKRCVLEADYVMLAAVVQAANAGAREPGSGYAQVADIARAAGQN